MCSHFGVVRLAAINSYTVYTSTLNEHTDYPRIQNCKKHSRNIIKSWMLGQIFPLLFSSVFSGKYMDSFTGISLWYRPQQPPSKSLHVSDTVISLCAPLLPLIEVRKASLTSIRVNRPGLASALFTLPLTLLELDNFGFLGPASLTICSSTFKQRGSKDVLQLINHPGILIFFQTTSTNM
jgi:hypothetical protein